MHYAVPVMLEQAEMLSHFYTDAYVGKGVFRIVDSILPNAFRCTSLKRFLGRKADLPASKITSFLFDELIYKWELSKAKTAVERVRVHCKSAQTYNEKVCRALPGDTDKIYAINGNAFEIFKFAKSRGIQCILEQCIAPYRLHHRILAEEQELWPGWETPLSESIVDLAAYREEQEWKLADKILGPSTFVVDGLKSCGASPAQCYLVPYGINLNSFSPVLRRACHKPLRILYVGSVSYRKGIPYLLEAAQRLGRNAEIKIAGPFASSPEKVRAMAPDNTTFLGQIPRSEIHRWFNWSDIFCFPSLFEGSATVVYEALASGLPVITTPNAGSVLQDGVDGYIVPIRDSSAICEKIDALLKDHDVYAAMSANSIQTAQNYSWNRYCERLIEAIFAKDKSVN